MRAIYLLHGWPGGTSDYRRVLPLLEGLDIHVPAFEGFGTSFHGEVPEGEQSAGRHAERLLEQIRADGHERPVLAGYDVGSRVAQAFARRFPDEVAALVVTPAYPGVQEHTDQPRAQKELWYQHLHRLELLRDLLDGDREHVATYLRHFWTHWADADDLASGDAFDALVDDYARPGALWASTAWYRDNTSYERDALRTATPRPPPRLRDRRRRRLGRRPDDGRGRWRARPDRELRRGLRHHAGSGR